jgi:predicted GNAT superfamily acetyltransferase
MSREHPFSSDMTVEVKDLHNDLSVRDGLLRANNFSARETSMLTRERFDQMISSAAVATFIEPSAAFLLAFAEDDEFDGGHFLWFKSRYHTFLYIDRIVVAEDHRRLGLGRLLYRDLFKRAEELGRKSIGCEVNLQPPNPISDQFHAALGFEEVGRATIENGAKTVRYLLRR